MQKKNTKETLRDRHQKSHGKVEKVQSRFTAERLCALKGIYSALRNFKEQTLAVHKNEWTVNSFLSHCAFIIASHVGTLLEKQIMCTKKLVFHWQTIYLVSGCTTEVELKYANKYLFLLHFFSLYTFIFCLLTLFHQHLSILVYGILYNQLHLLRTILLFSNIFLLFNFDFLFFFFGCLSMLMINFVPFYTNLWFLMLVVCWPYTGLLFTVLNFNATFYLLTCMASFFIFPHISEKYYHKTQKSFEMNFF